MERATCLWLAAAALVAAGCKQKLEVDHPFYLTYIENPAEVALFRCPNGPDQGCAIDGLPGPTVYAAGADARFVTVQADSGYYYFRRIPTETRGWGDHPERIVGPLTRQAFEDAQARLGLPDLSVRW